MKPSKSFDCVEMKDRLQAGLSRKYEGISDVEMLRRVREKLETSDDILARKWRKLGEQEPTHSGGGR